MAIDLNILLRAYAMGIFPMADSRDDPDIFWVEPKKRAILPLDGLHLSRSLRKTIRADRFQVTANRDFPAVLRACGEATEDRRRRETRCIGISRTTAIRVDSPAAGFEWATGS